MAFQKDIKKLGLGGIDVDTIDTLVQPGDVRILRNGRQWDGADGFDGSIRNILGNTMIAYQDDDFGVGAEVIGTCRDDENDGIIFFIAVPDASYRDHIIEYYPNTGTVDRLAFSNSVLTLNFSVSHRIQGAFVIDGMLYWNDNYNGLRKLNIVKAKLGSSPGGYYQIDDKVISLIKYLPMFGMAPYYDTDTTRLTNNLRGYLFQFRYSYIYDDNEESTTSPISKVPIPEGEFSFTGELVGDLNKNNVINLKVNTGHHTVEKIAIYMRIGNDGHWGLIETLNKTELGLNNDVYHVYAFYNDRVVIGVDQEKINKLFHAVPLRADRLGYIHTNNTVIAGLFEGYDNISDIDVGLFAEVTKIEAVEATGAVNFTWGTVLGEYYDEYIVPPDTDDKIYFYGRHVTGINVTNAPTVGNIIKITITETEDSLVVGTNSVQFSVSIADAGTPDVFRATLCSVIENGFSGVFSKTIKWTDSDGQVVSSDEIFVYKEYFDQGAGGLPSGYSITVLVEEYSVTNAAYKSQPGFKSGAEHRVGLLYYDGAGRSSFVQKADSIYLPFITESPYLSALSRHNYLSTIRWEINHEPPSWAVKYQWVRQKNLTNTYFRRYIIDGVTHGGVGFEEKTRIDISPLNQHKVQGNTYDYFFPNSSIEAYSFQKGDRVRFITKTKTVFTIPGLGDNLDFHLDMEILGYEVDSATPPAPTNQILVQEITAAAAANFADIDKNTLIEIYRPKKEQEDEIYYEMGDLYDVYESAVSNTGKFHRGPVGDQLSGGIPARGYLVNGDIYYTPTLFDKSLTGSTTMHLEMIESASASNYFEQDVHSIGRPNLVNEKAEQKHNNNIRLSGRYFEGTEINGLSEFYGDADLTVSEEFGDTITGLLEVGFTLKVLQERKLTSFFVGRTGLQLASGQDVDQVVASSADDLSTKSPAKESRGCSNPDSVIAIDRHLFFVDVRNGVVVRDAPNGMFDVDRYGLQKEIKYICDQLLTGGYNSHRILASHNPITNEVGFNFLGINPSSFTDFGTYYFKHEKNKWTDVFDWSGYTIYNTGKVDAFASINQNYVTFKAGKIWLHESNVSRNNFYGLQTPIAIEVLFNQPIGTHKLFRIVEITGIGEWACPDEGDIKIEKKNAAINREQTSRLVLGKFKNINGIKKAVLMKDMNTQDGVNLTANLINGKDLKGSVLSIRLINEETTEAVVDSVAVLYQPLVL